MSNGERAFQAEHRYTVQKNNLFAEDKQLAMGTMEQWEELEKRKITKDLKYQARSFDSIMDAISSHGDSFKYRSILALLA